MLLLKCPPKPHSRHMYRPPQSINQSAEVNSVRHVCFTTVKEGWSAQVVVIGIVVDVGTICRGFRVERSGLLRLSLQREELLRVWHWVIELNLYNEK